ncbi:DUF350 domain-containing protein [Methylogaea oryzae]|uniref:DUF350 domain-containing protein n=2 Tax=Methylogaea oryzae TaxID=1295382 RepID=A0A8D4VPR6_9GAMM|nr:DUF350 domain-containing protein [Methylogaea oryzae]BBL71109.1 hypothetical protein MoryE10_17150 [Methylogaea oryzae]
MEFLHLDWLLNALVFSLLGVVVFWVSFVVIDKLTPYDLWREIIKERNQPLATIVAAMCLGVAIIVAAAIHG